ncbi:MAG: MATE family efflux transporter [Armatimonadota bacterium]|nr:MATE family efflux transporter [Armatimonadota bacterium]
MQPDITGPTTSHRTVWELAWPIIALNSLQVVNSLLDARFISALGGPALNASGAAQSLVFLFVSLAFAIAVGATALVSRFYGSGERENLLKASRQTTTISLFLGIAISVLGYFSLPAICGLFVDPAGEAYREMLRYLGPLMVGIPAVYIFNNLAASLRAISDTKTPMVVSGIQILCHMALNFILIFPPRALWGVMIPGADLGIAGAGWAFAISAWISALLYFPASGRTVLGRTWKLQMPEMAWISRTLKIALPASLMTVIRVSSFAVFSMALKHTNEGEAALGAMRVGIAMEAIAFMPAFGYSMAASALVGQNLGARNPERAERLAWAATNQAVIVMSIMAVVFFAFAPQFAAFFIEQPAQRDIAISYMRIVALTEPLFGYAMVLTGAHQGAGDTGRPTWANFISSWVLRVPLVYIFAVGMKLGSTAAWVVMALTQAVNGLIMIYLFRKGDWKRKTV